MLENKIKETIRDVVDFPKEGIVFKDITPILGDAQLTEDITNEFVNKAKELKPDAILGIESRGFFWGLLMAQKMKLPFIPVRKKGKLPYKTISYKYDLEYGSAEIEMHEDAVTQGMNVLIHDDLLATGGTAMAAAELVKSQGGRVLGFSFLVNLTFLEGEKRLAPYSNNIISLVNY
jgi:adenine phosphoribosyltransferase